MDNFTAKDICAIIKACSQNSVTSLKIGEIEICLAQTPKFDEYGYYPETAVAEGGTENAKPHVELTDEQKRELAYARQQELLVTNPMAYEDSFIIDESEASLNDEAMND